MRLNSVFARFFALSILCIIGFAAIAIFIGAHHIAGFDNSIIDFVQAQESAELTSIMKFFTWIGAGLPSVFLTAVLAMGLYFRWRNRRDILFFIGVIAGSALLNVVLKLIFHRARPTLHRIVEAGGYSYPSGHSMAAFTLYGILCYLLWRYAPNVLIHTILIICGIFMIVAIGSSRIYLGVHYPSDVVGAYLASGAWVAISIGYYEWLRDKHI